MSDSSTPKMLHEFLNLYCDVNAMDMIFILKKRINENSNFDEKIKLFREQLADAIRFQTLTPQQYQQITGDNEYNTPEELNAWLRELWQELFDEEFK